MSTGIVAIDAPPRMVTSSAMTTNVYGRRSASLTIHMYQLRGDPSEGETQRCSMTAGVSPPERRGNGPRRPLVCRRGAPRHDREDPPREQGAECVTRAGSSLVKTGESYHGRPCRRPSGTFDFRGP